MLIVNNSEVFASIPTGVAGLKENVIKERKQHVQFVTMSSSWPIQEALIFCAYAVVYAICVKISLVHNSEIR